ncbi:MAG: hypothetical protein GC186_10210 [Rhodobacteraceae bacterium]|nr:hypothetical protein [Paracoccaceae bacterium]
MATTQHYWLTQGMARALGVNLSAAIHAGILSRADLDTLVARCQDCGHASDCLLWLGRNASGAPALPGYCENRVPLEALRRRVALPR